MALTVAPLHAEGLTNAVADAATAPTGALASFVGLVRGENLGRRVRFLEYEAYEPLALRTFALLGCRGFGRVDLMLDESGGLWVLEANPVPGLTETSLLPQAAEAAGVGFDELVGRVLELTG